MSFGLQKIVNPIFKYSKTWNRLFGEGTMGLLVAILAWLHVFFATGWIGGALLSTIALEPSIRKTENHAVAQTLMANVGKFMGVFSTLTIAFGVLFFWVFTGGRLFLIDSGWGVMMLPGITLGVVAYVFGFVALLPLAKRLATATQKSPKDVPALMSKIRTLSLVDLVLLALVFTFMVGSAFY